ncbi:unnamed protein product [Cyclocybe aegerita]|uniref:MYND-type domain-containing protein n=1 Tax=Cyclocybe aegerita TaxID=1973307 RepID=A0A8S0WSX9_CYCAE|nr:unnamed protein product [Cyclocybe aegerita]
MAKGRKGLIPHTDGLDVHVFNKCATCMGHVKNVLCDHYCREPHIAQLRYCKGCRTKAYCSYECQKKNWGIHRDNCMGHVSRISDPDFRPYKRFVTDFKSFCNRGGLHFVRAAISLLRLDKEYADCEILAKKALIVEVKLISVVKDSQRTYIRRLDTVKGVPREQLRELATGREKNEPVVLYIILRENGGRLPPPYNSIVMSFHITEWRDRKYDKDWKRTLMFAIAKLNEPPSAAEKVKNERDGPQ